MSDETGINPEKATVRLVYDKVAELRREHAPQRELADGAAEFGVDGGDAHETPGARQAQDVACGIGGALEVRARLDITRGVVHWGTACAGRTRVSRDPAPERTRFGARVFASASGASGLARATIPARGPRPVRQRRRTPRPG